MSKSTDGGDQQGMHPVLEKVPAIVSSETQKLSDYFWENPRIAEAVEWVYDNLDPRFTPAPLGMFWDGFFTYDGRPRRPILLTTHGLNYFWRTRLKDKPEEYERTKIKWYAFKNELMERFPEIEDVLGVAL